MKNEPFEGMITQSGNFKLIRKFESIDDFYETLQKDKFAFARHKIYHIGFIQNFSVWNIGWLIKRGDLWQVVKINQK